MTMKTLFIYFSICLALSTFGGQMNSGEFILSSIEMAYAKKVGQFKLEWRTDSELINDYFNIYRSNDGVNFKLQGEVHAYGSTHESQSYEWMEKDLYPGVYYYQLEKIDYDRIVEKYEIVQVEVEEGQSALLNIKVPN